LLEDSSATIIFVIITGWGRFFYLIILILETVFRILKKQWQQPGGYKQLFTIAVPLILSTGAWSIQHFVDRMFLTWYSPDAIAAALPASVLNFTTVSLFIGISGYISTFVAQYYGAQQYERIGPVVWQGLYIAFIGGIFHLGLIYMATPIFKFINHAPAVRDYEIVYFKILCLGAFPAIAGSGFSGFFAGRGKTWYLMVVNTASTGVNIILDYLLIFGNFGFPEMGMQGAGWATVISICFSCSCYLLLICLPKQNRYFYNLRALRYYPHLCQRIIRFGLPNGVQFFLDTAGFSIFILLVGKLGTAALAASNIALNINNLVFLPMIGLGMSVSILVGQYLGQNRPDLASRATHTGFRMTFIYMLPFALLYFFYPDIFINLYAAHANSETFDVIQELTAFLLKFVALYSIFDTMNIIFAAAIKGAGDTRFVMQFLLGLSLILLIIPTYLTVMVFQLGLTAAWVIVTVYIATLGVGFWARFRTGKWRSMRVIEPAEPTLPTTFAETPTPDI